MVQSLKGSIPFFLSQTGDLIHVPQNHISTVIAEPEGFGLTIEEILAVCDRHGETVGSEGEARKELLFKVVQLGWIRIRRYPNRHWSITASPLTPAVQKNLRGWAMRILAGIDGFREADRYMPVKISTMDGEFNCTIGELA